MAHSIIRMDSRFDKLASVKFYDRDAVAEIDNGHVVKLDGLLTGEREKFKGIVPAAITDDILIVAGVELNYDETSRTKTSLTAFVNEADRPFRGLIPEVGKFFSVSYDALTLVGATPVVGSYVIAAANSSKLAEVAALGGTEKFVGKIVALETVSTIPVAVIRIEAC